MMDFLRAIKAAIHLSAIFLILLACALTVFYGLL